MKINNQRGFTIVEGLLIVIALTLIGGVGYYVYNANQESHKNQIDSSIPKQEKKKNEQKPKVPELIDYTENGKVPGGIEIKKAADIEKLVDASDSFKKHIASLIQEQPDDCPSGSDEPSVNVKLIYKDQFSIGGIGSGCSGAMSIWQNTVGKWQSILGGQQIPSCEEVNKFRVPKQILPECYGPDGLIANTN